MNAYLCIIPALDLVFQNCLREPSNDFHYLPEIIVQLLAIVVGIPVALLIHRIALKSEAKTAAARLIKNLMIEIDGNFESVKIFSAQARDSGYYVQLHLQDVALETFVSEVALGSFADSRLSSALGKYRSRLLELTARIKLVEDYIFQAEFVETKGDIGNHEVMVDYLLSGAQEFETCCASLKDVLKDVSD